MKITEILADVVFHARRYHLQDFGHVAVKKELSVLEHSKEIANTWTFINISTNLEKMILFKGKTIQRSGENYREKRQVEDYKLVQLIQYYTILAMFSAKPFLRC